MLRNAVTGISHETFIIIIIIIHFYIGHLQLYTTKQALFLWHIV